MKADALIMAIGIRPNTAFLEGSGIEMFKGTILTDKYLKTNLPDIYAAGDCAMVTNRETGKPAWSPSDLPKPTSPAVFWPETSPDPRPNIPVCWEQAWQKKTAR